MTSNQPDLLATIKAFQEAVLSARAVADQLGLSMVGIRLDGALVELEKAIAAQENAAPDRP